MKKGGFKGMPDLILNIKKIPKELEQSVKELVEDTAQGVVRDAVNNVRANGSTNYGTLMQRITAIPKKNGLSQDVFVGVEYAPSVEWGTKGQVRVDYGLEAYASQFKGKPTGTWEEFLASVLDWVKKKGITGVYSVKTRKRLTGKKYNNDAEDERVAYLIARSIYLHGIKPKPFFFPAWFKNTKDFEKELNKILRNTLLKRIGGWFKDRL
ncbi:hypothetical protein SAMN05192529_102140 [Arachidicoccus rhizosphaerae]|uniref:Phage protein, HK97 gp10 family n=1 Tax=Arachidicoccus rhizosphaerae TaxID=551991 RepID=A0A1H3W5B1_9BACT|nr:hypothetical protein [Arachidicoccus rhizosphaerae]SDZ82190.1 hypothetical protein SAMN05192529_102140 [Arachidicoccus rhizosphaerae]